MQTRALEHETHPLGPTWSITGKDDAVPLLHDSKSNLQLDNEITWMTYMSEIKQWHQLVYNNNNG